MNPVVLIALEHDRGIDRLCMMLLGRERIRDVILFPQFKPK
jgi:lysyl-tRNA synthetase class II